MSAPVKLVDASGDLLHTERFGSQIHLVVEDHSRVNTQFKSATHTTNTTTQVVVPPSGGALVLTDLLLSGEKINGGIITIQFTDGTNEVVVYKALVTDSTVNIAHAFGGRWFGWIDGRIDFITDTANQDATVSIGYYFVKGEGVLSFADWDALRS